MVCRLLLESGHAFLLEDGGDLLLEGCGPLNALTSNPTPEYTVWLLHHADGHALAMVDEFSYLDYAKVTNGVGAFAIGLPDSFDFSLIHEDTRVAIWRKPAGGTKALDFVGFIRYMEKSQRGQGIYRTIAGPDLNDLLRRRIIAYAAGSAQSEKSATAADNVLKALVRENLGALAIAARDLSAKGFSVQGNSSLCTSISKAAAWRNLLTTLQEVAADSHTIEATCAYFGVVPLNQGWECEFRTNKGQWGLDHRHPGGAAGPVIFSLDFGNIADVTRNWNYRDECNYAYGGGQGEEALRNIQEASDAARIGMSPFNRCELFADARNGDTNAYVLAEAQAKLREGKPKQSFSGNITSVGSRVYGRDYGFGDYVTAVFEGETIDCRIESVSIHVAGNTEDISMQLKRES